MITSWFVWCSQARKNLVATLQATVDERRQRERENSSAREKDMLDALLHVEDENGRKLTDEEIIDLLIMYLNAGHESSGHVTMWATLLLQGHPEIFQRAKVPDFRSSHRSYILIKPEFRV